MDTDTRRVYRSRNERIIGGVGGGIGEYLGVDPLLIRLSFVALAFAGVGVLLYIIAWIVIPEAPEGGRPPEATRAAPRAIGARMLAGSFLIALGVFFLVDLAVPVRRFFVPMALVVIGIAIIAAGRSRS